MRIIGALESTISPGLPSTTSRLLIFWVCMYIYISMYMHPSSLKLIFLFYDFHNEELQKKEKPLITGTCFLLSGGLVFKYTKGEHNVYEVSEATFRSCDASSGVVAKYTTGSDQIELKEAKEYWFICDISGHCLDGMRFGVDVSQAGAASNTTASGTSASAPLPFNPNPNNASERGTSVIYLLLVLDLLLKFF